jgi:hypothetical protein
MRLLAQSGHSARRAVRQLLTQSGLFSPANESEPNKGHKLVEHVCRCVNIPDDPAAPKTPEDCAGNYEYTPDGSWKGAAAWRASFWLRCGAAPCASAIRSMSPARGANLLGVRRARNDLGALPGPSQPAGRDDHTTRDQCCARVGALRRRKTSRRTRRTCLPR